MAGPKIKYDQAGNAWFVDDSGKPMGLARQATPSPIVTKAAPPAYQYEGPQAALNLQRTAQEVAQAQATAAANTSKTKAEAQKAQIDAQTAQEQWNVNHPAANGTEGMSGPQYLQFLQKTDPGRAAYIQGLSEGRVPFPGAQMMRSPAGQALLTQVMRADPTIDATNYSTRAAARRNAATGTLSQSDNALITAIGHAARLHSLVPDVFGGKVTPLNSVANAVDSKFFGGNQPAYEQNARLLGDEVASAYKAGTGGERGENAGDFASSLATSQKENNILGAVDLMSSKLAANRAQFAYGNGQLGKPDFMLLPEQTRSQLLSIPGAAPIVAKYFAGIPSMGADGGTGGGSGGSGGGAGGGGNPLTPASGPSRTEYTHRPTDAKVAAMLAGGAPASQIKQFVADNGGGYGNLDSILAWRAVNPTYKGAYDVHGERIVPTTLAQRAAANPLSALPYGIANAATTGGLDEIKGAVNTVRNGGSLADNIAAADLEKKTIANSSPGLDLAGNIIGGAGAMLGGGSLLGAGVERSAPRFAKWLVENPIKAAALGDAGYGAAYGAGENNDNRLLGAAVGAPVGALGSFAGAGASKAVGSALQGVTDPAVQRLRALGIPLTVGETLGGGFKKAQDAMTSVFGPGNMVANRYADGRRALNQAFFNEAGNVIGAPINKVGQEGVQALDAAKNQAYSKALDPISLNLNTPSFIDPMKGVKEAASAIPAADLPQGYANTAIDRFVGNQIMPDGTMNGQGFQGAYRGLARTANAASGKVEGYDVGQALGQAKEVLSSTLQDQNPGAYQGFLNANRANRMLNIIAAAQKAAKNQISDGGEVLATPAQFGAAATNNAAKYNGNIAAASGSRPFNQLINDSQQVMSSKLPESGTVPRLVATTLATGGGAGLGYGANGGEGTAEGGIGTLGLLTALGTKKGQQLLTAALLKRTLADQLAGRAVSRNPQIGASILAGAGIPLLDSPSP